jgi:hypothetical protein
MFLIEVSECPSIGKLKASCNEEDNIKMVTSRGSVVFKALYSKPEGRMFETR